MINVDKLINELTTEEKACLLSGHKSWFTNRVSRIGLESIMLTDGPHGVRKKQSDDKGAGLGQTEPSTCFPPACTSANSWNKELLYKMGVAMGEECRYYNVNLILGPAVNIKRNPLCGRNFEYFSEDPLIAGQLGARLTRGIEDMGVGTSVKHFACNNNEANRYFGDSIVDERAYREIYLKAFEPIIKEGRPQTVMCSYNKVNGKYASENDELLNKILRDEWGFDGLVISDWGAVNDRVEGLNCGLDLEMPGDVGYNRQVILDDLKDGSLSEETLNTAVRRVLNMINNTTLCEDKLPERFSEHSDLAKTISTEGAVLMKNEEKTLPLSPSKSYLVVGEMFEKMRYQGAGSSLIRPYKLTTPKNAFDMNGILYEYAKGYNVNSFESEEKLTNFALDRAKDYDTILFFGGLSEYAESEGFDRKNFSLPQNQLELLIKLAKLGKKIVYAMFGGSPVDMSFDCYVDAVLNMYLPGQSGGEAVYDLLFGKACPSGKLAETWPISYSDVPFGSEYTKTTNDRYKESIFVGYRYYTSFNLPVKYPFGFGLSYTSFSYSNFRAEQEGNNVKLTVDVCNIGDMEGSAVVQIYCRGTESKIVKPLRELRGFEKVLLAPGESRSVTVYIPIENLRYFIDGRWQLQGGEYSFELCSDSASPILSASLQIDGDQVEEKELYIHLYSSDVHSFNSISDHDFDRLIGREISSPEITRPYDLNTPIRGYRTLGGRIIFGLFSFGFKTAYNFEKMGKNTPDKETRVKNAYFAWKTIEAMSLRSICYGSEGRLSHKFAMVLLDIANNHPIKAIIRMFKSEKCVKLPE